MTTILMKKTETQINKHGRERKDTRGTDIFQNRRENEWKEK